MRMVVLVLLLLSAPVRALAQEAVPRAIFLDLATEAHRPMSQIADTLSDGLPQFRTLPIGALAPSSDPFFAVLEGAFGAPGAQRHAGLVHCARYGIDTRDLLTSRPASDPAVFPILSALRAATDDPEVWPPDAIALFRCTVAWDDARRLRPWAEATARALVVPNFAILARRDDAMIRAEAGDHIGARYGADGFRLTGRDDPRSSHMWLESLTVSREISHQRVTFRAFLLGGLV